MLWRKEKICIFSSMLMHPWREAILPQPWSRILSLVSFPGPGPSLEGGGDCPAQRASRSTPPDLTSPEGFKVLGDSVGSYPIEEVGKGSPRPFLIWFPLSTDLVTSAQTSPQCMPASLFYHWNVQCHLSPKFLQVSHTIVLTLGFKMFHYIPAQPMMENLL